MLDFQFEYLEDDERIEKKFNTRPTIDNPVLYSDPIVDTTIVVEQFINEAKVRALKNFCKRKGLDNIQILTPLRFIPNQKDFKSGITQLYIKNSFDLEDYIPPGTKIISMGRSLYYLTRSADLDIETFQDHLLDRTYFYDPIRRCRVYVTSSHFEVIGKDNFENWFAGRVFTQCAKDHFELPNYSRIRKIIKTDEELLALIANHRVDREVAVDIETGGFDFKPTLKKSIADKILTLELSFDGITGYHIPFKLIQNNLRVFTRFLGRKIQIYANGKFDCKFLYYNGFTRNSLHIDHDIMQIRHTVNEMSRLSLKAQAFLYTFFGGYDFALDEYKRKNKVKSYADIPSNLLAEYGPDDAIATFIVYKEGLKDLIRLDELYPNRMNPEWNLLRLYNEIRIPTINNYLDMEIEGLYTSIDELDNTSNELKQRIYSKTQELYLALNIPKNKIDLSSLTYEETKEDDEEDEKIDSIELSFETSEFLDVDDNNKMNLNSNQQLGKYLEEDLGWRVYDRDKEGCASVNAETLARWVKDGHREAELIGELAKLKTLYGTFIGERKGAKGQPTGFYQYLYKHDDGNYRIHSSFASMLANSWRGKSRNPNLQNIPAHGEKASIVKRHFTTRNPSEIFYSEDFSGLQLRILGFVTNDPVMRDIFLNRGGDIHSITAYSVFCQNTYYREDPTQECGYSLCEDIAPGAEKMTLDMYLKLRGKIKILGGYRRMAKSINFGFAFSMAARTFALSFVKTEWSKSDIIDFIDGNDLYSKLLPHLYACGDVYDGLITTYNKHRGVRRSPAKIDIYEIIDYLKRENLFDDFENTYGFEEVEKLYDACAIVVGENIRESFFDTYKGLEEYGLKQRENAQRDGYVRSLYGNFRRLPYLLYRGKDTKGKVWANKEATAINSPIQSIESIMVNRWIINVTKECKSKNMVSRVFNKIHDASESFVVKEELREYNAIKKKWATYMYPELDGIPMDTESNCADYWGTKGTTKLDFNGNEVSAWELWDIGPEVAPDNVSEFEEKWERSA